MSVVLGIDIGTSYCRAAYWNETENKPILVKFGKNLDQVQIPTAICFSSAHPHEQCLIGQEALDAALNQGEENFPITNLVLHLPRLIGRRHDDIVIQHALRNRRFCCNVVRAIPHQEMACVELRQRDYTAPVFMRPEEVLARMFIAIRITAEAQLHPGTQIRQAVVTVPACFNNTQRKSVLGAGAIANLSILRLLSTGTATMLSSLFARPLDFKNGVETVLLDFGGGHCACTYSLLDDGIAETRCVSADATFAGEDIDERMVNYFIDQYRQGQFEAERQNNGSVNTADENNGKVEAEGQSKKISFSQQLQKQRYCRSINFDDPVTRLRLKFACEKAKIELSTENSTKISLHFDDAHAPFTLSLTKERFEQICEDLILPVAEMLIQVMKDWQSYSKLDLVLVTGGSARIPKVQQMIEKFLISVLGRSQTRDTAHFTSNTVPKYVSRNVSEFSVVEGAAIQAEILCWKKQSQSTNAVLSNLLTIDVLSSSVGIETAGGVVTKLVKRNVAIPSKFNNVFSTYRDNQSSVAVKVFEGESGLVETCTKLAEFDLGGIPPAPRGVPQIQVAFDIDVNGVLSVSAHDQSTGRSSKIIVDHKLPTALAACEIEPMCRAADRFAAWFEQNQEWVKKFREQSEKKLENPFEHWKELGGVAFRENRHNDAIQCWIRASTIDPSNAVVHSNLSCAFLKLQKTEQAKREAETCIANDKSWWKGYFRLGKLFETCEQDYKQAKLQYEKAKSLVTDEKDLASLTTLITEMEQKTGSSSSLSPS